MAAFMRRVLATPHLLAPKSGFARGFAAGAPRLTNAAPSDNTALKVADTQQATVAPTEQADLQSLWKAELGHISGQPAKQASRHVHIYSPAKTAMQSGTYQTRYWKIVFDTNERWENPLMGWTSSADPLQAIDLTLRFQTKEAAVQFAEKNGWDYTLKDPQRRNISLKRTYADNFRYEAKPLRIVKTK